MTRESVSATAGVQAELRLIFCATSKPAVPGGPDNCRYSHGIIRTYNAHTHHVKSILLVYRVNLVDRNTEAVKNPQDARGRSK